MSTERFSVILMDMENIRTVSKSELMLKPIAEREASRLMKSYELRLVKAGKDGKLCEDCDEHRFAILFISEYEK